MAGWTGLEPATFCVTGRRSNQLSYHPVKGKEAERRFFKRCVKRPFAQFLSENFPPSFSPLSRAPKQFSPPARIAPHPPPPATAKPPSSSTNAPPGAPSHSGAVGETRTRDRRFRKPLLYPAELPPQKLAVTGKPPRPARQGQSASHRAATQTHRRPETQDQRPKTSKPPASAKVLRPFSLVFGPPLRSPSDPVPRPWSLVLSSGPSSLVPGPLSSARSLVPRPSTNSRLPLTKPPRTRYTPPASPPAAL